jgi:hypothetical protein
MKLWHKSIYKPRYWWYRLLYAWVYILHALFSLILWPFGYESNILDLWAYRNLRLDMERRKRGRTP